MEYGDNRIGAKDNTPIGRVYHTSTTTGKLEPFVDVVDSMRYAPIFVSSDLSQSVIQADVVKMCYPNPEKSDKNTIVDVEIIGNGKVVRVTFADGSQQKAVCQDEDVFSLEEGITICLCKQLMGGSGNYNRAVNKAVKIYDKKIENQKIIEKELARIAAKTAKNKAKFEKYKKQKEEKRRNEQIAIQREAFVQAIREVNKSC